MTTNRRSITLAANDPTLGNATVVGTFDDAGVFSGTFAITYPDRTFHSEEVIGTVTFATDTFDLSITNTPQSVLLISGTVAVDVSNVALGAVNFSGLATGAGALSFGGVASPTQVITYGVAVAEHEKAQSAQLETTAESRCATLLRNIYNAIETLTLNPDKPQRVRYEDQEVWYHASSIDKLLVVYERFYGLCGEEVTDLPDLTMSRGPARGVRFDVH